MLGMDVFTWAAIALVLGPVLAGLAIPVLRWIFNDPRRLLLFVVVLAALGCYWKTHQPPEDAAVKPAPARTGRRH